MAHHLYPHLHFHSDDASYYELNAVDDPPLLQPPPPPPLPPLPPRPSPSPSAPHEREAAARGVPQWSHAETAEFLAARAELDRSFAAAKRNKPLWEAVSARLRLKGFARTPDQCKSKWKNLLTRFKGSEAMEQESERQFPFYEEMRRIFSYRMERLLAFEKSSAKNKKGKELMEEEEKEEGKEEEEEEEEEERGKRNTNIIKKNKRWRRRKKKGNGGGVVEEVEGTLREMMRRQAEMEERWMEAAEAREAERREKEGEWRRAMADLWEERLAMERRWRQRDDDRRARADARAERQHALVSALLAKLQSEGS